MLNQNIKQGDYYSSFLLLIKICPLIILE